jgi:glyoxylase-like metal-dependent hydrolase (beta-lactamase superfamily II)
MLIAGDLIFKGSVGRTDLPGGDHNELINSVRNEVFVLPDHTRIYSGHGEPTNVGHEKMYNPFFN